MRVLTGDGEGRMFHVYRLWAWAPQNPGLVCSCGCGRRLQGSRIAMVRVLMVTMAASGFYAYAVGHERKLVQDYTRERPGQLRVHMRCTPYSTLRKDTP